jgi:hypothetical protein
MGWRHNLYNKRSSKKYGWEPEWFEATAFDDTLTENIRDFQMRHSLTQDGFCGSQTHRRILAEREAVQDFIENEDTDKHIICDGNKVQIAWNKVNNIYDVDSYALPSNCYRRYKSGKRDIKMIITHFDVCLSANSCRRALKGRNISSHFVIDNDGTIYQMVDPQHSAWHAGRRVVNRASIGIDISNGYYTKYQDWYRRKGFGRRPVLEGAKVHGVKLKKCLGFYPVQIEAYKVLVETLCNFYDIPIEMPMDEDGTVLRGVSKKVRRGKFSGIANHFHVTRGKIDAANLDWDKVLKELGD